MFYLKSSKLTLKLKNLNFVIILLSAVTYYNHSKNFFQEQQKITFAKEKQIVDITDENNIFTPVKIRSLYIFFFLF